MLVNAQEVAILLVMTMAAVMLRAENAYVILTGEVTATVAIVRPVGADLIAP